MLYVSTRDRTDSFTAHRVLNENFPSDGGLFVPMRLVPLSDEKIHAFGRMSFGEAVADILCLFFPVKITDRDVELSVGRHPFRLHVMSHKLVVAEFWRNPKEEYAFVEQSLYSRITGSAARPTDWAKIAIRIAVLFGVYSQIVKTGIYTFDVSVVAGDFMDPIAIWYAKKMGLPLGNLICCCDEHSGIWDLIHRGVLPAGGKANITDPFQGSANEHSSLERLIFGVYGRDEVHRYSHARREKKDYHLPEAGMDELFEGITVSVISNARQRSLVRNIYRTSDYLTSPSTAAALSGLQDYRSRT